MSRGEHRFTAPWATRAIAALMLIGSSIIAGAVGPTASVAASAPHMGLVSQTPYGVEADGTVAIVLSVPNRIDLTTVPDAILVVTAYQPVTTRDAVAKALRNELPRSVDSVDLPLSALTSPAVDQVAGTITLETSTRTPGSLQLAKPGLYPVLIELRNAGTVLAEVLTFVHRLPTAAEPAEVPLPVAIAMATTSPVVIDDSNEVVIDDSAFAELGRLADLLEASPMPISVSVPPALLIAASQRGADGAALAQRLIAAAANNTILSAPRLPLDPSLAAAAGQQLLYTQWLRDGEDDLALVLAGPSSRTTVFMSGTLTAVGGVLLRDLGARLVVTTPSIFDALPASTGGFTDLSQLVYLEVAPGVTVGATVTDRTFGPLLTRGTTTPALTGIYATTDLLAYRQQIVDADENPARHGVTLATSDLSLPNIDTYRAITAVLAEAAGIRPTSLDDLGLHTDQLVLPPPFNEVTVGLPTTTEGSISERIATKDSLTAAAHSTASMLPEADPRPTDWQQLIDRTPTSALIDAQVAATANELIQQFGEIQAAVEVATASSFTLTGTTSTLPIKLFNHSDVPLTVRIHMSSSKLSFPQQLTDGDQLVTVPPQSYQEAGIQIEARSRGNFPVTLQVLTPAGDELAPPVSLTASVNALSGLGNLVTGAFLLVVLTWWVRNLRRARRSRAAAAAAVRHPVSNGDDNDNGGHDDGNGNGSNDAALSPDAATSTLPPL